jgi:hypothetical protein
LSGEIEKSERRRFVRNVLSFVAVGGASMALLGRGLKEVAGQAVSGVGTSGEVAYWSSASHLAAFPSFLDPTKGSLAFGLNNNIATASGATVGGGVSGAATGVYATVAGGFNNTAGAGSATVGGGASNTANGSEATIGGGGANQASAASATVGGGFSNVAGGTNATIGGGNNNFATVSGATVGGGHLNAARALLATIGGGETNTVSGAYATIPGGFFNSAGAENSLAAGSRATVQSAHHGAMLFSDDTFAASGVTFQSTQADEFAVRAIGGVRFVTGVDSFGNTTRQLTVSSSGLLGLSTSGASTPAYALDLRSPGKSGAQMHISPADADSGGYLTSANAGNLFMSAGAAWNGSAWVAKSSTSYQYGGGVAGVRFFFDTGLTVGSTYTPTTRMFIGPTGHVGIGMSTAPAHLLQLGLDDAAKPSTNTWTIASDGRLKDPESIEPFTEGSEFIKRLPQPVWFRYRKESGLPSDRSVAGWIAQDLASVAPFMIRRTKQKLRESDLEETETLSLNTNELPYALVNSTKELLHRQEEMLARLEAKEYAISELKARLEKLENKASAQT